MYLAAAHTHPAMALAAMASSSSFAPGSSSIQCSPEALFPIASTINSTFPTANGFQNVFTNPSIPLISNPENNITSPKTTDNTSDELALSTTSSTQQPSFFNTQHPETNGTRKSALKAALQFSTPSAASNNDNSLSRPSKQ